MTPQPPRSTTSARAMTRILAPALSVLLTLLGPARSGAAEPPARILILSGQGNTQWRTTTPILRRILEKTGRFDARVCETPGALAAADLAGFDLIVDDAGAATGGELERALKEFVESGHGLMTTRGALAATGSTKTGSGENSTSNRLIEVAISQPDHPISHGLGARFTTADLPIAVPAALPGAVVIAQARDRGATGPGPGEPAVVASTRGKGRSVACGLGHDLAAMHENTFRDLFTRCAQWAAAGTVSTTLAPKTNPVRGLLITGGHDHEAAFYTLFAGDDDIAGMPVETSATAFQNDIRGKYDVVILYDFSRTLSETGRKNLLDYIASGKGLVVLHHALLDYPDWNHWSNHIVGGRYRLKPEGGAPSSTVKNGQQLFVSPAGDHPITAGIGPFHIEDETYKRMYLSPSARPLLTTDNPASDPVIAWIGPGEGSRVVAIQLGHGPTAFSNPAYRKLVKNAVLWSARRLR